MKVLIDIGHPAHVHYYRNFAKIFAEKGHNVIFLAREKDVTFDLLKCYNINYIAIGSKGKNVITKVFKLFSGTIRILFISCKFKPDILLNASPSAAFVSWLLGKYHISLEDTFNMEQVRLYLPFTNVVLTGDYQHRYLGKKEIVFPGYQELAYLHPNRYSPNPYVFQNLGITKSEKYAIVRFVSWNATHDIGHKGISLHNKIRLVKELSKYLRVFISSEAKLHRELEKYKIKIKPEQMHDALHYAHLYIGESATMASECAVLGTPAIFLDTTGRKYTEEQEKRYQLVFNFTESEVDQEIAINKAIEMAKDSESKKVWMSRRELMLKDKIDVTAFLVWFVENYPESESEMRKEGFSFDRFK